MIEFKIECEECEETTYMVASDHPEFCPMCGRRTEAILHKGLDLDEEDWD
jgi:Zn finger protein HypA/HybF involved in hydrogenase expression